MELRRPVVHTHALPLLARVWLRNCNAFRQIHTYTRGKDRPGLVCDRQRIFVLFGKDVPGSKKQSLSHSASRSASKCAQSSTINFACIFKILNISRVLRSNDVSKPTADNERADPLAPLHPTGRSLMPRSVYFSQFSQVRLVWPMTSYSAPSCFRVYVIADTKG